MIVSQMNSLMSRGSENGFRKTLYALYSNGSANMKKIKLTMTTTIAVPLPFLITVDNIKASAERKVIGITTTNQDCSFIDMFNRRLESIIRMFYLQRKGFNTTFAGNTVDKMDLRPDALSDRSIRLIR